ncbi:MAG: DUF4091 domain-containing protein [Candidatus Doudnabacteria bacterium]|nr:DUF4091 domain-containing protein [bacterium]MDZ4243823.1 DUF4091 domain-containing protein [Candidatus Doudnabacteria bacterium]
MMKNLFYKSIIALAVIITLGQFGVWRPVRAVISPPSFPNTTAPTVWATDSMDRIGQTRAAGLGTKASISAARGEYESFQVIVRSPSQVGLSNVNLTVSSLTGPNGATIPSSAFTLFREHYVNVFPSSPLWGTNLPMAAGMYADALIPFVDPDTGASLSGATLDAVPTAIAANHNQPFWVDVLVPRQAAAGVYTGTYTVSTNLGNITGQIELRVWNFTLPLKPSLRTSFLVWTSTNLPTYKELLRNRIEPNRTDPSMQQELIDSYGLGDIGLPFWSGADNATCTMSPSFSVAQINASKLQQQTDLRKYVYSADEISSCPDQATLEARIKEWGINLHAAGVEHLIVMPPRASLLDDGTGKPYVDIWPVLPVQYDNNIAVIDQAKTNSQVWSYNTLVQDDYSPKWLIDFAAPNFRLQPGFISQALGLKGLLYWRVDRWQTDPWNNVNNVGVFSASNYPGDGMLVYPGAQVGISGVAPSLRLKWLRDGVDDYDYVEILKSLGANIKALQIARTVGQDWNNWSRDPAAIASARTALAAEIERYSVSPPSPITPPKGRPSGTPIKYQGNPTVYFLENNQKRGIPSYGIYLARFRNLSIATIPESELYDTAETLNFPPGSLLKIPQDRTVYLILDNSDKYAFKSIEEFQRFGFKFDLVQETTDEELSTHPTSPIANLDHHARGNLIKYPGSSTVYRIENNTKRAFSSPETFFFYGDFSQVITIDPSFQYPDGAVMLIPEGALIRTAEDPTVYLLENNTKRAYSSAEELYFDGYSFDQVRIGRGEELPT